MGTNLYRSLEEHFKGVQDPRRTTLNQRHLFLDILVIAICGAICGANDWVAIARFGKAKETWLRRFLELPNGIPSHDTFGDVFSKLQPEQFQQCFIAWVSTWVDLLPGEVVAIDGKTLRHSYDQQDAKAAIHMVSAWASSQALVLGQLKTAEKSNEITAIPQLLAALEIKGCLVTIDAMGCQKKIAETILSKGADYLLAVKDNQPKLHEAIKTYFEEANAQDFAGFDIDFSETFDQNHGRLEWRRCWRGTEIQQIETHEHWPDLTAVVMIESERHINEHLSIEHRYYISSASGDATSFLPATREHWSIENSLHWVLDIAFREDDSRIRKGYGPENFATLRHMALNLLKQEPTAKVGIQNKRLIAGWDNSYLEKVLRRMKS
jgi:predicted transposase YbfD/YdcC